MDDTRDGTHGVGDGRDGAHPSIRLAPIDHDEYDALADLFLGDGELAPGAGQPDQLGHETHTPVLQLTHDVDERGDAADR